MAKKYKIINQDYFDRNDIQIEVTEEIVTPVQVNKSVFTVGTINNTIDFLKEKKAKMIIEIDAEIQKNQEIIDSVIDKVENIEIKEIPTNNVEEN